MKYIDRLSKILRFRIRSSIATQRLIDEICKGDVSGVIEVIKTYPPGYFNIHYRNLYGNSLMHLAAMYAQFHTYSFRN